MENKGLKIFAFVTGGIGMLVVTLAVAGIEGLFLALVGIHLTEEVTGSLLVYTITIACLIYTLYYAGIAFLLGFRRKEYSWKWGLWMSGGFLLLSLISWPIATPYLLRLGIDLRNLFAFAAVVFLWTIPAIILSSLGGYLGAKYKFHRLKQIGTNPSNVS